MRPNFLYERVAIEEAQQGALELLIRIFWVSSTNAFTRDIPCGLADASRKLDTPLGTEPLPNGKLCSEGFR